MADESLKLRIAELEDELSNTKVNKRTEASVGLLKGKIARLKEELEAKLSKSGKKGEGYSVKKEGDATIGFLGRPSVGKSTLLSKITNKESRVGAYEFTTLEVVPGLLHHKFTNFQVLDLPGIIKGAADNKGFGKKVLSVVRVCDLIVFIIDPSRYDEMEMLLEESFKAGIRVNKRKPFIEVKPHFKGGVSVPINLSSDRVSKEFIEEVLNDRKIINAEVMIHEEGLSPIDFVDSIYNNLVYARGVICLNKIDLCDRDFLQKRVEEIRLAYPNFSLYGISADREINLEGFKDFLFEQLGFIWIYLKEQRKEADLEKPLVLKAGDSVERLCEKIHKDFLAKFKYAKVKGSSVRFDWQRVGLDHVLGHGDIVEIYAR